MLVTGRASDVLPSGQPELAGTARLLGYPPDGSQDLVRTGGARHAGRGPSWNASSTADRAAVADLLTAASAVLGTTLAAPEDLGGSKQSCRLRGRLPDGGSVVIKSYPETDEGRQSFARRSSPASGSPRRPA